MAVYNWFKENMYLCKPKTNEKKSMKEKEQLGYITFVEFNNYGYT